MRSLVITNVCFTEIYSNSFSNIFFIDSSTIETINAGFKNIAVTKKIGTTAEEARQWLTRNKDWLLFFDNADDPTINLKDFLPQCNHGNVIITSRNPELRVHAAGHKSYTEVSDMEETEAIDLLLKRALQEDTLDNVQSARNIVKVSHCSVRSHIDAQHVTGITLLASCNYPGWCICCKIWKLGGLF